jgi:capsular polysaccharide export protein
MDNCDWRRFKGRRVLLLQGPVGPFFGRLSECLSAAGVRQIQKIDFNGGDWLFSPRGSTAYRGTMQDWPDALRSHVAEHGVDTILLYGDCREVHRAAHALGEQSGVEIWVFEEGYVRPNYITLERSGVNNRSTLSRDPAFYRALPDGEVEALPRELHVTHAFMFSAIWAVLYYLAAAALRPWFPHYEHHRPLTLVESLPWFKSVIRKSIYRRRERALTQRLTADLSGRFFLLPLQVAADAQVVVHSNFKSITQCIDVVASSFAESTAHNDVLVIKHHPMDRGSRDYSGVIKDIAAQKGLQGRIFYVHDQHLPTLLDHAKGVVVINSTVGMQALDHGKPVIALGQALYDIPGLTFQGPLESFWTQATESPPVASLYRRFRSHMIRTTQLNGSVYLMRFWPVARGRQPQAKPIVPAEFGEIESMG